MPDISTITLPSGTTYNFKDAYARDQIEALEAYSEYLGVTSTELTDGSTTNPITIGGESVIAKKGNIVNYGSKEYIFNGTTWQEFGDLSALGSLAYKNSASGSFTPSGTVSQPTFTGASSSVTISAVDNTNGNYQPKGTVSKPTFTGTATTSTGKFTPTGTVNVSTNATTNKIATVSTTSGTATYTPAGTVSAPTISVATAGSTTTIKNPTSVTVAKTLATAAPGATAPANPITYYSVTDENLKLYQIGYTTGASITTSNVTVKTGDAAYESSAPTFSGTGVRLVTGNIPVPNTYTATFTGTEDDVSVSGTPSGTVSQPTFTGTKAQISGSVTPSGTVSQPTFTGTSGTVTVS